MNQNDIAKLGYLTAFQAFQQQITDTLVPYMQQQQLLAQMMNSNVELASVGYRIPTPSRIVIAGCGGTGGWFIPKLVKIVNECITKFLIFAPFEILLDRQLWWPCRYAVSHSSLSWPDGRAV